MGAYSTVKMMQKSISDSGYKLFLFNTGRESTIGDRRILSEIWRNRRLMASPNGTHEEKNCTEPGKMGKLCGVLEALEMYCIVVSRPSCSDMLG